MGVELTDNQRYSKNKIMNSLTKCRQILREIHRISAFSGNTTFAAVQQTQLYTGVMNEYRKHQSSANVNTRHIEAAKQDEANFLKFLHANIKHQELLEEYHTKGEKCRGRGEFGRFE